MRSIEIDEDVWQEMQRAAHPLVDSPNSLLRRMFGLDKSSGLIDGRSPMSVASSTCLKKPNEHCLVSARHCLANQEIWWYGIPPLGKKYRPNDLINFRLENFRGQKSGELTIELSGRYLDRIDRASKDKKGYTHVKIVRALGENETSIYFGRKEGDAPEIVSVSACK